MTLSMIYDRTEELVLWAEAHIAGARFRGDAKAIGIARDGETVGVFVFDTISTNACFMHVASDGSRRWLDRSALVRVFAYPFLQCGFRRVSAVVSSTNAPSLNLVRKLGAVEEGRMRHGAHDGEDLVLFGLLREECRWLEPRSVGRRVREVRSDPAYTAIPSHGYHPFKSPMTAVK